MKDLRYIYFTFLLGVFSFLSNNSFSQNTINSALYGNFTHSASNIIYYCSSDGEDILTGVTPVNGDFVVAAPLYAVNNATSPATARINPSLLPLGDYNIEFNGKVYIARIVAPPVVTLDPLPDQCQNGASISLIPYGNPAGGVFSGPGVTGTSFNPATAGAGSHIITYTYPATGCRSSATQTIVVNAVPAVTLIDFTPICINSSAYVLTQGSPIGGTYSGVGVAGGLFDPAISGVGTHAITYTVVAGGCSASATKNQVVNALPAVTFSGLNYIVGISPIPWYCDDGATDNLIGSPLGGSFSGAGITNVVPAGNATFDPKTTGLGEHNITYSYTDLNGCSNSQTQRTRVGTIVYINGLDLAHCEDDIDDAFLVSPYGVTSQLFINGVLSPLSPIGEGVFDPNGATSIIGVNQVRYEYTDESLCLNRITNSVQVDVSPLVDFTGLNATQQYCFGAADILLTGNYAPNGSFSGDGILNHGNGTATFQPSTLGVGTYSITYTYTTALGCTDSKTKSVEILPLPNIFSVNGGGVRCAVGAGLPVGLSDSEVGFNYQLYRNNIPVVPNIILPGTGAAISFGDQNNAGTYTVMAIDATTSCTQLMSGSATVTVNPPVVIVTQPTNITTCEDGSAIYTLQATGQNITYQWFWKGVDQGVNNNVLVLNGVASTDNNSDVYCVVSSTCGGPVTSNTVKLYVNPKTVFTTHPVSSNSCTGSGVTFSTVANGLNNVYRWEKDGIAVVDVVGKITGSNSANLSIFNLAAADAGTYICYVDGDCGVEVPSNPAILTIDAPIVITNHPASVNACAGTNISYSIVATGTGLMYQWQKNGVDIVGANSSSLVLNAIGVADVASYRCVLTSPCGATLPSNIATLTIPANTAIVLGGDPVGGSICEGSNFNFSVTATGSMLTYEWFKDAAVIPLTDDAVVGNSSSANLTLTGTTAVYEGSYRVRVSGTCGVVTSAPANLLVYEPISFVSHPASLAVCSGSDASFSVNVIGDVLGYQWQRDVGAGFVDILGATSSNYIQAAALAADAGSYRCRITTTNCGNFFSNVAILTVNPNTTITVQPVSKNSCVGNVVSFSITATGVGLAYQWYKNAAIPANAIVGATNATLNLAGITAANAGDYICVVTGGCGPAVISSPGSLAVDVALVISTNPQSASVCFNSNHDLTVALSAGTNPIYQWYFNGGPVGVNSPIHSIPNFNAGNVGNYYVTITNGCGTVTSNTAALSLVNSFTITDQPDDIDVCVNGTATFTVVGSQPGLSYQWRRNGVNIVGATSASLVIPNVVLADNGSQYTCVVSNSCNVITSNIATLTVSTAATITQQPLSDVVCVGENLTLITVATGSGLTYQWYKNNVAIGGAVNPAYTIDPFAAGDVGTYHCVVTSGCGSVKSSDAFITLGTPTTITDPVVLTLCEGDNAIFSTTATGSNLVYEWRKNDIPIINNGHLVGANTSTLTINSLVLGDEGTYNVVVTGACGLPEVSTGAYLDVVEKPVITQGPDPRTVCNGSNVSFSVVATGENLTYRWQKDGVDIAPAETNSSLNIAGVTDLSEGIYRCVVTNATCGSVNSTSAELVVEDNVSVVVHPVSLTRCEGSNVTFVADVNGPSGMVLQWFKGVNPLSNNARINGVTLETLSISNINLADAGDYWLQVTSSCGNAITNTETLTVQQRISITQQPQSITVCPAGTLNLSVIATGTITNYQWKRNGVNVGANSPTYTVTPFIAGTHDGSYTCELTNICETVVTDVAIVTAGVATNVTIVGDVTACEGANTNLAVNATGSNLTYQWYKGTTLLSDGARIGGSQTASLTINGLLLSDAGTYKCEVLGTCGFDDDNTPILTVQGNTTVTTEPVSTSVLVGNNAIFTTTASGSNLTYQWYKGAGPIADGVDYSGTNTSVLNVLNADLADAGTYKCVITGDCGVVETKTATLTVLTSTVIITQPVTPVNICQGAGFTIFIQTSGVGHTYQWKRDADVLVDGVGISGSQTASLTINNALPNQSGAYTCVVNGVEISAASIVTVNPTTIISTNPVGGTKCQGDTHILSVTATGTGLSYQWYKDNVLVAGAISNEYILGPLTTIDAGTYHCVVSGVCSNVQSSGATLVVNSNAVVNAQPPVNTIICQTATTSLLFDVSGTGLTYLWKKNGLPITDANISGITTNNLQISAGIPANSGDFTCTVTSLCGGVITSDVARVTVNPSIVITVQPIGRTKCEGDGIVFTVDATGSNLTYAWQRNGVPIVGATASTLSISPLDKATHEGTYRCLVTGDCGSLLSDPAILTINRNVSIVGAPVISTNPVCENSSTTITINATGDGLTYLWRKNGALITGANISGQTTNQLIISNATIADAGVYSSTVTGACGTSITSVNVNLTVNPNTVIVTQPLSYTKCNGDEVTFAVQAQGNGLTYQWKKGDATGPNVVDDARISGATTNILRISGIVAADAGSYTCVVTGSCGIESTTPAVLTVNGFVNIDTQPLALTTVCQGTSTEINVTVSGTVASYQWKKNGVNLTNAGNISGVNTSKLVIANALIPDAGFYSCEITGTCNVVSTISAELRVNPSTVISQHPSSVTLCEGDNAQFFVVATGVAPLTYQWQLNNVDIPGATNSSITINGITPANAGAYTCIVSGASTCGAITSNPANLTVNPKINILVQPLNTNVCEDNTAIFTVDATGTGLLNYKWLYNNVYLTDNARVFGATTKELRVNLSTNADEGIYKCEIYSACGNTTSNSVALSVTDSTKIVAHPLSQNVLLGTSATFNVSATGAGLTYQWQYNNSNIVGANSSTYSIAAVALADAGQYRCIVTGSCGTVTSNIGILTVNELVSITAQPSPITRCVGESASFSVTAVGTIVSYQWKFNGVDIVDGAGVSGSKTSTLVISSVLALNAGNYSCVVTGSNNVANSNLALLTVNQIAAITSHPLTQTKCVGDMLVLEVLPNDPTLTYTWQRNGAPLPVDPRISGANANMLVITSITPADAGNYRCVVSNSCATETSNPAVITINPAVNITSEPSSITQCVGQTAYFSVVSNISTSTYQWFKNGSAIVNGANISGATSANLIISNLTTADAGNYSCRVTDNCTVDNSLVAQLTVRQTTIIQNHPQNTTVCEGGVAFFEVNATPTGLSYQWQLNGVNLAGIAGKIEGANTSVLVVRNAANSDEGVYRCLITGGCNVEITNTANLTVNEYPAAAGVISGIQTVCQGTKNILYVVPEIANATTYVWDVPYGATIVGGMGSRTIQVDYSTTSLSGVVTVYGQNSCGSGVQSAPLAVTVNPLPVAYAGVDQSVCSSTTQLEGNNVVGGTWTIFAGDGVISNPNNYLTNVDNLLRGENSFIWTVTQLGCTASDTVKITNLQALVNAGTDQVICSRNGQFNALTPVTGASWTVINGYGTIETPSSPTSRVTGLNQGVNTFGWQVNNAGCITSDQVVITNNAPFPPEAGPDQIVAFDATDLNADVPEVGTTGFWQLISGGGVFTDPTDPKTRVSSLMPGPNILVWTVQRVGCILTDTITVENILVEPAEAGTSQTLCVNFTTLNATRPPIGTGEWSVITGQATFDDKFKPNAKVTNLGQNTNVLRWTVRTSILGVTWDEVTIINNMPTQANAGPDMVLCTNQINLAANQPVYGTSTWTLNSGAGNIADITLYNSLITNLGPGKNELKWTIDYNGCISEDFVAITNNTPTVAYAGEDQTICFDSTLLLPNTPTYGVPSWSVESGRGIFDGNVVTQLAPGINTFVYTITNGTCRSTDRVSITNNKPTTPNAGYDQSLCVDNTQLSANFNAIGTGSWTIINGSGTFSSLTVNNPTVTNLAFGDNIFRWTITNNGCTEHDEVIVSNNFILATAGLDETLCWDSVQMKASNPLPGVGTWTILAASAATFENQNAPNTKVRNLSKGVNSFRWTVTNKGCVSFDDVNITNNEPTRALAGENQSVCSKSANLYANEALYGTGIWTAMSGAATFTDPNNYRTTVNNLAGGQNVLRWTITNAGCVSFDEVIITSNLATNVFAGNDQVACSDTAVLSANPPSLGAGQWSIISGAGSFDNRYLYNTKVRNLGQGDNVFRWTVSSSDCHVSDTVIIRSSIPTRSIAGANQVLCSSATTLGGNTPTNGVGTWTVISGSVVFADRNKPNTDITNIALGTNILAWVIDKDGCQSSSELTITNNQPSTPFAGYDRDLCGDSIRLFADPPSVGTGYWTLVSGDANILNPSSNQARVVNIKFGPNTFRWTVTNKNCIMSDDVVISSNYSFVNAGADFEVNVPTAQLIGNVPSAGTGTWSLSAGQGTIVNPASFETWVTGLGAGSNVFEWSINYNGCVATDAVTVNYVVWPTADFEPSTYVGCSPLEVNFVNTSIGGAPYSWDFGDGSTSGQPNVIHTFQNPGVYTVKLTATAPLGNTVITQKKITVYGPPTANFDIAPKVVYVPGQHISCYNYSVHADTSHWNFGDGKGIITKFAPTYTYTDTGMFDITLKVVNAYGCVDSMIIVDAIHVIKRSGFFFPEAFTPNPSGSNGGDYSMQPYTRSNDVLYPILVDGEITEYQLMIFNRMGVMIFKSNDIKIGWDGYYQNKLQPQDVYIYKVSGRYNSGERFEKVGNVLLLRVEN